jgi:hypothetical protein
VARDGGNPGDHPAVRAVERVALAQDWYRRTALADLLGVVAERINDDQSVSRARLAAAGHLKGHLANSSGSTTSFCFTT